MAERVSNKSVLANSTLLEDALEEWKNSKTGPLADIPTNNLVWGRLPSDSAFDDPGPGPNAPHWELILALNLGPTPEPHVTAAISIVSPTSRAYIIIVASENRKVLTLHHQVGRLQLTLLTHSTLLSLIQHSLPLKSTLRPAAMQSEMPANFSVPKPGRDT